MKDNAKKGFGIRSSWKKKKGKVGISAGEQ